MNDDHDATYFCVLCLPWPHENSDGYIPGQGASPGMGEGRFGPGDADDELLAEEES